jgi:cytochrome c biogenesis protein CcmG/thiol:disulfide interchange protein DsbE
MNRFVVPLLAFGLLVIVLAVGVQRSPEKSTIQSNLIGKPAPAFVLPALGDGVSVAEPVRLTRWRGKWIALNVWGTWCVECRVEHGPLLAIKAAGQVPIVSINWKDDPEAAREWLRVLGDPYAATGVDPDSKLVIDFGVYGAPETFLIDPQGIIRYRHAGALTAEIWQQKFLSQVSGAGGS